MKRFNQPQSGFSHVVLISLVAVLGVIGIVGWRVLSTEKASNKIASSQSQTTTDKPTPSVEPTKLQEPDSAATLDNPEKISASNGQYFMYGAPAGQNNASPKKIIITLHGTEGSGDRDYEVWLPFVKNTSFALASLNWWDGSGDKTTDYSTPEVMLKQIHGFLDSQNYTDRDVVVFEGFSRGSANSYPIVALDRASASPLIDVAVSSSGGATNEYFDMTTTSIPDSQLSHIFTGVNWVLACGGKDANPQRDGCPAMENSKNFVQSRGATVLGILSDPDGIHGALTTSKLDLTKQLFELIEAKY